MSKRVSSPAVSALSRTLRGGAAFVVRTRTGTATFTARGPAFVQSTPTGRNPILVAHLTLDRPGLPKVRVRFADPLVVAVMPDRAAAILNDSIAAGLALVVADCPGGVCPCCGNAGRGAFCVACGAAVSLVAVIAPPARCSTHPAPATAESPYCAACGQWARTGVPEEARFG